MTDSLSRDEGAEKWAARYRRAVKMSTILNGEYGHRICGSLLAETAVPAGHPLADGDSQVPSPIKAVLTRFAELAYCPRPF
jgi:hypothetical protein